MPRTTPPGVLVALRDRLIENLDGLLPDLVLDPEARLSDEALAGVNAVVEAVERLVTGLHTGTPSFATSDLPLLVQQRLKRARHAAGVLNTLHGPQTAPESP